VTPTASVHEIEMDPRLAQHYARVRHLRESFAEANERLVARLRGVTSDAAEHVPAEGWSAAQIGWHVAAATTRFAGLVSGEAPGAQPLPADFRERDWAEIVSAIPPTLQASAALQPPKVVHRDEAISALEAAGLRMARAFDALTPERGTRFGLTHPITGLISVYQVGEWATAHVIRHNRQAKRVLGQG
jgi:hypothetical protein